MQSKFGTLVHAQDGQSMVEYGIIVAVIAALCIGGYRAVGQQVVKTLDTLIKNMKT